MFLHLQLQPCSLCQTLTGPETVIQPRHAAGRLIQRFSNLNVNAFVILRQLKTLIQVTTPLQSVPSVQCRKAKFYIFIGTETSKSRSKRIHQML